MKTWNVLHFVAGWQQKAHKPAAFLRGRAQRAFIPTFQQKPYNENKWQLRRSIAVGLSSCSRTATETKFCAVQCVNWQITTRHWSDCLTLLKSLTTQSSWSAPVRWYWTTFAAESLATSSLIVFPSSSLYSIVRWTPAIITDEISVERSYIWHWFIAFQCIGPMTDTGHTVAVINVVAK